MENGFKKSIILILAFSLLLTSLFGCDIHMEKSTAYLKVGDFIEFGRYQGNEILWQIIKKDNKSILLISQYILCYKPFDANSDKTENRGDKDRIAYGSNFWATSNLHDWLNSDSNREMVEYTQKPPSKAHVEEGYNDYENEAGFLNKFTEQEKNAIRPFDIRTALADVDKDVRSGGTSVLNTAGSDVDSFTDMDSYSQTTSDKVFILSTEEIKALLKDKEIPVNTTPTSSALTNSGKVIPDSGKNYFWARTPDTLTSDKVCVIDSNHVLKARAYSNSIGVRPAICIDNGIFRTGNVTQKGTIDSPYKFIRTEIPSNTNSDFDISRDGYSFDNSGKSFGYESDYKIPVERYIKVFGDPANPMPEDVIEEILNVSPWVGSCMGMSVTAKLFDMGFIEYSDFKRDATCAYDFSKPENTDSLVTEIIEQYQIYQQFGKEVIDEYRKSPKDAAGVLDKAMNAGPVVIELRGDYNGECGHALLPYKFEKLTEDTYKVYVYDCNEPYPGSESKEKFITVNKDENTWEYKLFSDKNVLWGSGKKYSKIYCRSISAFMKRPTPSWYSNVRNESNLYISNANSVIIKSKNGYVTYTNGELENKLSGAWLIPYSAVSKAKSGEFTKQFILPAGEYVITAMDNSNNSKSNNIVIMGNDKILIVRKGNNITPVTINPLIGSISLKADSNQNIGITLYKKSSDSKNIAYSVTGLISKNSDVNISFNVDNTIKVLSNKTNDLSVKVVLPKKEIIKEYNIKTTPNIPIKVDSREFPDIR